MISRSLKTGVVALAAVAAAGLAVPAASALEPEWIVQKVTPRGDDGIGVATDADGNIYMVGSTYVASEDALVRKYRPDGQLVWERRPGTTKHDRALTVTVDGDGNVYVAGLTAGPLGGSHKGGRSDAFLLKFDRDGRYLWKRQPGTAGEDFALGVATDSVGNVYLAGSTNRALAGTSKGGRDPFVLAFDRDGQYLWKRQPGMVMDDLAGSIVTDTAGNAHVLIQNFERGNYVIKYDPDGRTVWRQSPGVAEAAYALAIDATGIYATGNSGRFRTSEDLLLIKFDRDGQLLKRWQRDTPGADEFAYDVAADGAGHVYIVGYDNWVSEDPLRQQPDAFVIKFDGDLGELASDRLGTPEYDFALGVATDTAGNAYVAGYTFGPLGAPKPGTSADPFLIKYTR